MVETGILAAGQLSASTLQQSPQSLPASHAKDSERFQDLITGGKLAGSKSGWELSFLAGSIR